jgi:hypothetical protein
MTTRPRSVLTVALLALLAVSVAVPTDAQQLTHPGPPVDGEDWPNVPTSLGTTEVGKPSPLPDYGTSDWSAYTLGPCDVVTQTGTQAMSNGACYSVEASAPNTTATFGAGVHLPAGALVQHIRVFWYASAAGLPCVVGLYKLANTDGTITALSSMVPNSAAEGDQSTLSPAFSETVDNMNYTYLFRAGFTRGASTTVRFRSFAVYYKLQVSPAPAIASFTDVPTNHWAFQYIEALRASGITGGCGGGAYCPDNPVTRAQMAVFLAKSLGLHYAY